MITVKNLQKSFGPVQAVKDLSFTINKGEIVGFLGPNGAGKTTTMRLLTGFLSPDSGIVEIDGLSVISNVEEAQRKIGYLPENNPLYMTMLVSEMFDLAADLKGIPADKRKEAYDFAVSAVSIEDMYYRPVNTLSKGYRQRVGMALALMHKPDIIIMDEPTEGLDPNQRNDIRNLIKDLSKDRTIILSTHVMQEALALSNRILIINKGMMVADGTPESLTQANTKTSIVEAEIEGSKILSQLKKITLVTDLQSQLISKNRYKLTMTTKGEEKIQPLLSRLAASEKWIIWQIQEQHLKLEDVFQQLTQTNNETE